MNSMTMAEPVISRPKVHRLPTKASRKKRDSFSTEGFLLLWGGVILAFLVLSLIGNSGKDTVTAAKVADPAALDALVPSSAGSPDQPLGDEEQHLTVSSMAPISDARAAGFAEKSGKTIMLQSNQETIVGQLTKIPMENEHVTEVKPSSDIDNHAGRELLSIISKY